MGGLRLADESTQGLLFDFDGTLVDTESAATNAWRDLFAEHEVAFPEHLHRSLRGSMDSESRLFAALVAAAAPDRPPPQFEHYNQRNVALANQLPARFGVVEILRRARRCGWMLAVTSGSSRDWVCHHLDRIGLLELFDTVVTGEGHEPKPAPDIYLEALRRCGLSAHQAIAFEDSAPGVLAAVAAGIRCVAVPTADGFGANLYGAECVRSSFSELFDELFWQLSEPESPVGRQPPASQPASHQAPPPP